ncbi:AbrB/MazE/SpoVT family DNA-binding domain-containing protein [Halopenitus salinus]|uniref:AbrB/MazE/SpoVT family DNA-binding domain-containing protein n=1 Tax=Halopenitus salinus TaxID=1198295 RepID=A0ABD5UU18_9EURY
MGNAGDGTIVTVTSTGEVTIPPEFCDKLHINTRGRVRFVENEEGEIVIQPVKRPSEIRGALAYEDEEEEKSATMELRDERETNKQKDDEK